MAFIYNSLIVIDDSARFFMHDNNIDVSSLNLFFQNWNALNNTIYWGRRWFFKKLNPKAKYEGDKNNIKLEKIS